MLVYSDPGSNHDDDIDCNNPDKDNCDGDYHSKDDCMQGCYPKWWSYEPHMTPVTARYWLGL